MNIVVTLKQVHDPNIPRSLLRISADGSRLELPAGTTPILNGYDANAVEESLKLRALHGGTVTAISVGAETSKEVLKRAIGMGVDQALHIQGPAGNDSDSQVVASLLVAAIRALPAVELVLSGRQASDTDAGLVPFLVAGQLGWPAVSPVRAISRGEDSALIVDRIADGAVQRLRVQQPVVLGLSNEINKPRSPSIKGVMAAKRAVIPTRTPAELGIQPMASRHLQQLSIRVTPPTRPELIRGSSAQDVGHALAERLRQEGLI
jgi:electron transfer flavoprotein beta subunit